MPMPEKTPTPVNPSLAARQAFLAALDKHFPQLVQSLYEKVFTPHRQQWKGLLAGMSPIDAIALLKRVPSMLEDGEIASAKSVASLAEWLQKNHVRDEWLYDVAVETLRYWTLGGELRAWRYEVEDQDIRIFTPPEFGMWLPSLHTRQDVSKLWTKEFRKQLQCYLNDVEANWGTRLPRRVNRKVKDMQLEWHAELTALRFMGMKPEQILECLPQCDENYNYPDTSICTATDRFARKLGGLTFPGPFRNN